VRKLAGATEPEIAGLPGIGPRVAAAVLAALRPDAEPDRAEPDGAELDPAELDRGAGGAENGTDKEQGGGHGDGRAADRGAS
jgi:hypothetical protein